MLNTKLFDVIKKKKINKDFDSISRFLSDEPTRLMMDDIFSRFNDIDGNFIEQFQTTGFDARVFELYLFAYFEANNYKIMRNYERPDFIIERDGQKVAIEATTVNKSSTISSKKFEKLDEKEKLDHLKNEIPIRIGSSLFSKLKMKYWELEQCKGIPLVLAVEPFYDEDALQFSSSSLSFYLYGKYQYPTYENGNLQINDVDLKEHTLGNKIIPSNFFDQPGAEHISAILFSNSGTTAKFKRMGYQKEMYSS